jgi:hypothetical protein
MPRAKSKFEVNYYEAYSDGRLGIHVEDQYGTCIEIIVKQHDVSRMTAAGVDALQCKPSRR